MIRSRDFFLSTLVLVIAFAILLMFVPKHQPSRSHVEVEAPRLGIPQDKYEVVHFTQTAGERESFIEAVRLAYTKETKGVQNVEVVAPPGESQATSSATSSETYVDPRI